MYSSVVQEHFHNPRRVGPLANATHKGVGGTPGEGPYVVLWFVVEEGQVAQAAYRTFGCPAAIASASMVAELAEKRSVVDALALTEADIVQSLVALPEGKEHCPPLAIDALQNAFKDHVKSGQG